MVDVSIAAFILLAAIFIFLNRKKIDVQFPVFLLKDNKLGQKIFSASRKWAHIIEPLSDVGVALAFLGMAYTFLFMFKGTIDLFTKKGAAAQVSIIVPGVQVPGSPIFLPFWYGIISLAILAVVHEMSHGIVASAHGMKPKSVALVLFLFIPGAGVELDEKKMYKRPLRERLRVYAAGSFANVITALLFLVLALPLAQAASGFVHPGDGIKVVEVEKGTPAYGALSQGDMIMSINGKSVYNLTEFKEAIDSLKPGEEIGILLKNGTTVNLTTISSSENSTKGRIGIKTVPDIKVDPMGGPLVWLLGLFQWAFMLNIGVGAMNLLPVPFLDGGRMFADTVAEYQPKRPWIAGSVFALSVLFLLLNILVPIIRNLTI